MLLIKLLLLLLGIAVSAASSIHKQGPLVVIVTIVIDNDIIGITSGVAVGVNVIGRFDVVGEISGGI